MATAGQAINAAAERLALAGIDTAHYDARLMVAEVLGLEMRRLPPCHHAELDESETARLAAMLTLRLAREPMSHILGRRGFWTIELEEGWSLFATHPVNRDDLPFRSLTGLVSADRFTDVGINFPAIWLQPDFQGVLPKGTPVAQCFPVPRVQSTLIFEGLSHERSLAYSKLVKEVMLTPGIYRKRFRAKPDQSSGQ